MLADAICIMPFPPVDPRRGRRYYRKIGVGICIDPEQGLKCVAKFSFGFKKYLDVHMLCKALVDTVNYLKTNKQTNLFNAAIEERPGILVYQ